MSAMATSPMESKIPRATGTSARPNLPAKRLAERMRDESKLIDAKHRIYHLPVIQKKTLKGDAKIARCYIGKRPSGKPPLEKVLMVVGATGAGKSTLINGIVNYLFGVRWEDDFRFKLIVEQPGTQAVSVTQWITAYTIYHQEGSPVPYTFTIIDTPGFGDTGGLERDKKITAQIKEFFSTPVGVGGIDQLDGIGFVTQAALARLTHTQRYIFDSILATFGKDIGSNIFMMVTFADGKKPPVVDAIKAAEIPYRKYFKFNNSALFPEITCDDQDEEEGGFDEMFWKMGTNSFATFFKNFQLVESRSLTLTREVLEERHRLETTVNGLQPQITAGLSKIEELQQEERVLKEHEKDILTNKDFTYPVKVTKQKKIDLSSGHYVTNCLTCNHTCHPSCAYADDRDKYKCSAMDGGGYNAKCTVCPGRCGWQRHVNNPYRFEFYDDTETRTSEELKQRYLQAMKGKSKVEGMIGNLKSHLDHVDRLVKAMIHQVHTSLERLDQIALKPNPLSEVEYIDLMIESEKQELKPGWSQRVQYLQGARKQAEITKGIRNTPGHVAETKGMWDTIKGWWNKP